MPATLQTLIEAARYVELQAELAAQAQSQPTLTAAITIYQSGPQQEGMIHSGTFHAYANYRTYLSNGTGAGLAGATASMPASGMSGKAVKVKDNAVNRDATKRKQEKALHSKQVREQRAYLRGCMDDLRSALPQPTSLSFTTRMTTMSMLTNAEKLIKELEEEDRLHEMKKKRLAEEKKSLQAKVAALQKEVGPVAPTELRASVGFETVSGNDNVDM